MSVRAVMAPFVSAWKVFQFSKIEIKQILR